MPGSTHDNYLIRDANSNEVTFRSLDVSSGQDGSKQRSMIMSSPYPADYGVNVGGSFRIAAVSGSIAAGIASGAPVFSLRNSSATVNAVLRRLRVGGFTGSVGFAAGIISLQAFIARTYTVNDSGGTVVSLAGKIGAMRAAMMAASQLADFRVASTAALTAGTRTLDSSPVARWDVQAPTTTNTVFSSQLIDLIDQKEGEHPIVLGQNEGLVLAATAPATGVWSLSLTAQWDEIPLVNY